MYKHSYQVPFLNGGEGVIWKERGGRVAVGLVWFGIYAQILGMYAAAAASNQAKLKGYPGLRLAHPDSK